MPSALELKYSRKSSLQACQRNFDSVSDTVTHASIVADEIMTLSSGRFFMILIECEHQLCLANLLLHEAQQQVCVCTPLMCLIDLCRVSLDPF